MTTSTPSPAQALWLRLRDRFGHALMNLVHAGVVQSPDLMSQVLTEHPELYAQIGRTLGVHWTTLASWRIEQARTEQQIGQLVALPGQNRQAALDGLLHGAVTFAHDRMAPAVGFLLGLGANPNACQAGNGQRTALAQAATNAHAGTVIEQLVAAGGQVQVYNAAGQAPLHEAARLGHLDTALALVRAGAAMHERDPCSGVAPQDLLPTAHTSVEGLALAIAQAAHRPRPALVRRPRP